MKAYLRLISLLLLLCQLPCLADAVDTDSAVIKQYNLLLQDFEYKEGKTKLSNLPPFLDKWYIRKILKKDLSFFFANFQLQQNTKKRSKELLFSSDGEMILTNNRFKIKYTFTPIIDEE